ncbi:MAG: type II secretion system protein [Candidatus Sungiibacteriota bacterium]|uniref:Type II secretion system protein n=1 Tax=Candidatus Sungiibacteriota bacterium TaxID=2750080 RepID=A0A7T5RK10_9BACT|nr:MAG: type II secretion system protein [Candidatus Sungbacteria bacterium]
MRRGITLLEVVVSVAILALLGAVSLVSFTNSRRVRDLTTAGGNVLSILRFAQARALGGEDNSPWGVKLEQNQFTLFRGASFSGSTLTEVHALPSGIEVANIVLAGGGQEIVFKKISGATDQSGGFDLRTASVSANTFSVTVEGSGKTYQTGSVPAALGSRIADARHRSFGLGWSIKNSVAATLVFFDPPNPDTVSTITMTPAPPRTIFDWTGTIVVGGQNQTLRIHAVSISDTNTTLHIDRDCRKNNKKLKLSIDTREIATYGADCQTVTVGAFGGVMSEP